MSKPSLMADSNDSFDQKPGNKYWLDVQLRWGKQQLSSSQLQHLQQWETVCTLCRPYPCAAPAHQLLHPYHQPRRRPGWVQTSARITTHTQLLLLVAVAAV